MLLAGAIDDDYGVDLAVLVISHRPDHQKHNSLTNDYPGIALGVTQPLGN